MGLSLVFATMDWSAFWLMVLLLWGTMGMLAFLQANAQGEWVDWWLCRLAETRFIIGGQFELLLYFILGVLAVIWFALMGGYAFRMVWMEAEEDAFDIPLFFYYGFRSLWYEWYHGEVMIEELDFEW